MGGSKLDRTSLARTNTFYNEHVYSVVTPNDVLPSHVEALRETILDFSWAIRNQGVYTDTSYIDFLERTNSLQGNGIDPIIQDAKLIRDWFNLLHGSGCPENNWQESFVKRFFDTLAQSETDSTMSLRRLRILNP
jgi:hypothetical protein